MRASHLTCQYESDGSLLNVIRTKRALPILSRELVTRTTCEQGANPRGRDASPRGRDCRGARLPRARGRYRKIRASLAPMTSQVALRTARLIRARRSTILLYHGVGPTNTRIDPGFLRVRPEAFREQLGLLLESGFETVTVDELVRRSGGRKPPPGLVALSFDDGMDDNHSVVLPLLREHGVRATVFVTTGLIGKPNPWMAPESGARMMTVEELRDLAAAGFEIGAHTVSHPDLSRLGFDECLREMRESRDELERTLGVEVRTFAYPSCHYGPAAVEAARAAGFTAAVTCQGLGSWKRYEVRRSLMSGKDGTASFLAKLTGFYEPLSTSPPGRLARATTRKARTMKRARAERRELRGDIN